TIDNVGSVRFRRGLTTRLPQHVLHNERNCLGFPQWVIEIQESPYRRGVPASTTFPSPPHHYSTFTKRYSVCSNRDWITSVFRAFLSDEHCFSKLIDNIDVLSYLFSPNCTATSLPFCRIKISKCVEHIADVEQKRRREALSSSLSSPRKVQTIQLLEPMCLITLTR
ncbi:hypothetical protein ALC57_15260, partial [Trachymyrmex cornetzi]